jgi:hypothetical protein
MNRRGFFGALASVCGVAAGAAAALPAPKSPVYGIIGLRTIRWRGYAAPYKRTSAAEVAAMMKLHLRHFKGNLDVMGGIVGAPH